MGPPLYRRSRYAFAQDFKKVAGNVIKNRALNYAAGKLGLNAAQASGLSLFK